MPRANKPCRTDRQAGFYLFNSITVFPVGAAKGVDQYTSIANILYPMVCAGEYAGLPGTCTPALVVMTR
jgi:hypothetical protein